MAIIAPILASISSITWLQWLLIIALLGFFLWRKQTVRPQPEHVNHFADFLSQAPYKKYSEIPQVTPHWFLGNESFGGELLIDTTLNHYKALGDHR